MHIDTYRFGYIEVNGRSYTSDVIIGPERVVDGWWRKAGHSLFPGDLAMALEMAPRTLIIGTGHDGRMQVPEETRTFLKGEGIEVRTAETGRAVALFNELQAQGARVVAALHLTC
jgi:hypothetical protein